MIIKINFNFYQSIYLVGLGLRAHYRVSRISFACVQDEAVLLENARVVRGKWGWMKTPIVEGGGAA